MSTLEKLKDLMGNTHVKSLERWLSHQTDRVKKNAKIITPRDKQPFMLHISVNAKIPKFEPVIGFRQGKSEDRTIPRVCVCETLIGCMIGYVQMTYDYMNLTAGMELPKKSKTGESNTTPKPSNRKRPLYKGGYYIYGIPFKAGIQPNEHLVYDEPQSGERWLVNYGEEFNYKGTIIGKLFIKELKAVRGRDLSQKVEITHVVYIEIAEGIYLSDSEFIEPGCYQLTIRDTTDDLVVEKQLTYQTKDYELIKITPSEFEKERQLKVNLLGFNESDTSLFTWADA